MNNYIVQSDRITGTIEDFETVIVSLAEMTGAKVRIVPCIQIVTDNPALAALLEKMTGENVTAAQEVAPSDLKKRQKKTIIPTGKCSTCGREAQLVKATGTCKPCYMLALKKAKAEGKGNTPAWKATEQRIDAVVRAAKEKEAAGVSTPDSRQMATRDFIAVKKF